MNIDRKLCFSFHPTISYLLVVLNHTNYSSQVSVAGKVTVLPGSMDALLYDSPFGSQVLICMIQTWSLALANNDSVYKLNEQRR